MKMELNYWLELVRGKYADPMTNVVDENTEGYIKKLKERNEKIFNDSEFNEKNNLLLPFRGLENCIENMKELVTKNLPKNIEEFIINNIAIGGINNKKINAASYYLGNNKYVIVMNYGLMIYLNKALKYIIGATNPKNIVYCNRCEPNQLTGETLMDFLNELSLNYLEYGEPLGAKIILDIPQIDEQIKHLFIIELFVLCHELGHILNGDFENEMNLLNLSINPQIKILNPKYSHGMEYVADNKGFELLVFIFNKFDKNLLPSVLISIVILFNFLSMIMDKESSTHPFSIDRSLQIAKSFYGDSMFSFLKSTYKNPKMMIEKKEVFAKLNIMPNKLFEKDSIKTTLKL
jgi:hypothetical protein